MEEISISKFKATCLAVVRRIRKSRRPVRITLFGEPVVDVIPSPSAPPASDWLGAMRGTATVHGDIISPATDADEWEALRS